VKRREEKRRERRDTLGIMAREEESKEERNIWKHGGEVMNQRGKKREKRHTNRHDYR
jgi:hypothetical protein